MNSEIHIVIVWEKGLDKVEAILFDLKNDFQILEGNKVYIYKVNKESITKRTEIKIGARNGGFLEVTSGLKEGETIVAEGLKKVRPNGKIKPIKK